MDRRKVPGRSKAELVMSRVGHGIGLLCLFLLPLLPLLLVLALGWKAARTLKGSGPPRRPGPGSGAGST